MRSVPFTMFFVLVFVSSYGQNKFERTYQESVHQTQSQHTLTMDALKHFKGQNSNQAIFPSADYSTSTTLDIVNIQRPLKSIYDPSTGQLIAIKGTIPNIKKLGSHEARFMAYLNEVKSRLHLKSVTKEIKAVTSSIDEKGRTHTQLDQYYKGVKVYGGELTIHEGNGNIYMLQGKTVHLKDKVNMNAEISKSEAIQMAQKSSDKYVPITAKLKSLMTNEQSESTPLIYPKDGGHVLAWHVDILVNLGHRESMIIDAISGEIIDSFPTLCKIHNHSEEFVDGKLKSTGVSLGGTRRDIDIFQCGSEYLLIDASKAMYKGNPQCADADALINGVVITLNAGGH